MPQYILLRRIRPAASGKRGYRWHVLQQTDKGWITLVDTETLQGGDDYVTPHVACSLQGPDPLPEGRGLVGVRLPDLNLDGRPDLLFECRTETYHDMHYCLSSAQYCASHGMRYVKSGELLLDVDLEFRDGWFIRTARVDSWAEPPGNIKVDGVRTPDPAPAP
jgi:hypothetical protein